MLELESCAMKFCRVMWGGGGGGGEIRLQEEKSEI